MRFVTRAAAFAGAVVLCGSVAAAQTQVTSRGALGGASTITWDALGTNGGTVGSVFTIPTPVGNLTGTSPGNLWRYDAGTGWFGGFADGDNVLYSDGGAAMTFTFASPISGFATQLWNDGHLVYAPTISLFNQGTFLATFSVVGSGGWAENDNQAPVLGATYANGFDQVVIASQGSYGINQLSVVGGVTTTPEPGSMALLGTGLVGLVPMMRRRRR